MHASVSQRDALSTNEWVGMGSGKCDEAPLASECAETSRAQDCALTAVLLGRTTDSDV